MFSESSYFKKIREYLTPISSLYMHAYTHVPTNIHYIHKHYMHCTCVCVCARTHTHTHTHTHPSQMKSYLGLYLVKQILKIILNYQKHPAVPVLWIPVSQSHYWDHQFPVCKGTLLPLTLLLSVSSQSIYWFLTVLTLLHMLCSRLSFQLSSLRLTLFLPLS